MKKKFFVIFFFLVCITENGATACMCTQSINSVFNSIAQKVETDIGDQATAIGNLIPEIKKNTDDIKEQNKVIEKLIEAEKKRAEQNTHIVFLLKQIMELKTVGEH